MFAALLSLRGDAPGATVTMERAIAQRPNDAAYWSSYGSALLDAARYDDAIAALKRACEYDPTTPPPGTTSASLTCAACTSTKPRPHSSAP